MAPRALLGHYNVVPGAVGNARSEHIRNALEAAYADGFDVVNRSLGGGAAGVQDLLTVAVDNLDQANRVLAIANGNEGPGYRTVGSPGSAARGLTAGASAVSRAIVHPIKVGTTNTVPGVKGEFGAGPVTAPLQVVADAASPFNGLSLACSPFATSSFLQGRVALISRGVCDFSVKMRNVRNRWRCGGHRARPGTGRLCDGRHRRAERAHHPGLHGRPGAVRRCAQGR